MTDFNVDIKCPHCRNTFKVDCKKYATVLSSTDKDNGMGLDTQWGIECKDFACQFCGRIFPIEGTIDEYPVGVIESTDVKPKP